ATLFVNAQGLQAAGIYAYRVGNDGSLSSVAGSPFAGAGNDIVAANPFLYTAGGTDIAVLKFNSQNFLTPLSGSPFAILANGPLQRMAACQRKFLYVTDNNGYVPGIFAFATDSNGGLTPVAGSPFPGGARTNMAVDSSCRFLFANSFSNGVAAYTID